MKNLKAPFLVIALFLNVLLMFAESPSHPPAPTSNSARSMSTLDDGEDCELLNNCEASFPIDQNIVFLAIAGFVLGATVLYKNQTKKASI